MLSPIINLYLFPWVPTILCSIKCITFHFVIDKIYKPEVVKVSPSAACWAAAASALVCQVKNNKSCLLTDWEGRKGIYLACERRCAWDRDQQSNIFRPVLHFSQYRMTRFSGLPTSFPGSLFFPPKSLLAGRRETLGTRLAASLQ